jgi:hypothetical protein
MGKRLRFYEFKIVTKDSIIELKPFNKLYFDHDKEMMFVGTNHEIKSINLNNAAIMDNFTIETSNINS